MGSPQSVTDDDFKMNVHMTFKDGMTKKNLEKFRICLYIESDCMTISLLTLLFTRAITMYTK